jgi:DNA-binding response OmpR family regulator
VPKYLIATESDQLYREISAALDARDVTLLRVASGSEVASIVGSQNPDVVVLDLQIGSMGGIATCINLRHEAGAGRLPAVTVLLLLDREADRFIAHEAAADAMLVKPLSPRVLARQARALAKPAA